MLFVRSFETGSLNVSGGLLDLGDNAVLSVVTIDLGGTINSLGSEGQGASIGELYFYTGYFEGSASITSVTFDTPNDLSGAETHKMFPMLDLMYFTWAFQSDNEIRITSAGTKTIKNGHVVCKQADFMDTQGSGTTLLTMTGSTFVVDEQFTVEAASSFVCDDQSAPLCIVSRIC